MKEKIKRFILRLIGHRCVYPHNPNCTIVEQKEWEKKNKT